MGAHCCFWPTPHVVALLDRFAPEMAVSEAGPAISAIVFDHYGLTAADHRPISQGRPTLVVDDLANRPLAADLVVDVGPLRREAEYQPWVGSGTRLLLGPHFAPVRPDFVNLRSASLARRGKAEEAQTALVAMGLTDVGGHSADIVEALLTQTRLDITVVLGREAPSLAALTALADIEPRLTVHVDAAHIADLITKADIAFGAGGSSTWERCVLGVPSLLVTLADNQLPAATALATAGAALIADARDPAFGETLTVAIGQLVSRPDLRVQLSHASAQLCDGGGAARTANIFLQLCRQRT